MCITSAAHDEPEKFENQKEVINKKEAEEGAYYGLKLVNDKELYSAIVKLNKETGEVFILGRLDNQIKLRGLRIEIGEIESAISAYPGIKSLVVLVKKIKDNDHLCAYFTVDDEYKKDNLAEGEFSIDIADLKATISEKLTYYMVPTVYMELDDMPQTLNGKTDIKNLPEPIIFLSDFLIRNQKVYQSQLSGESATA